MTRKIDYPAIENETGADTGVRLVRVDDLIETYGALRFITAGCWRGVRTGRLTTAVMPRYSLALPGELQRNIGGALRSDLDELELEWTLPTGHRVLAIDELDRVLDARERLEELGLCRRVSPVALETLVKLREIPGAVADSARSGSVGTIVGEVSRGTETPGRDRAGDVPRLPIGPLIGLHEWLARINQSIWSEMSVGRLSRDLAMPGDILEGTLELTLEIDTQISRAVRSGHRTVRVASKLGSAHLLSTVDSLEARLKVLPFAAQFGVYVPHDPASVSIFERLLDVWRALASARDAE